MFQGLVKMIAQVALKAGSDIEAIKAAHTGSQTMPKTSTSRSPRWPRNITLRAPPCCRWQQGVVAAYVPQHGRRQSGKMASSWALESAGKTDELASFAVS